MTRRSKFGLRGKLVARKAPQDKPLAFTATIAWLLGSVILFSLVVLVWLVLESQPPG